MEVSRLETRDFIKRSIKNMLKMRNLALEASEPEMRDVIVRSTKKIISFCAFAQNEKSSPGGTRARIERCYKEKY